MLARFFAQFDDVPTVNFHAGVSAFLATMFTVTLTIVIAMGRSIDLAAAGMIGGFILGYLGKTSVDFHTKRNTEIVTPPAVMASEAAPAAMAATTEKPT